MLEQKILLSKPTEAGKNEAALDSFERGLLAEMNIPASFHAER
jgi:hypothetical protein